jgi:hypothetical protein
LAISVGTDSTNTTVIETNHGVQLRAPGWPQDCEFQLVAFDPLQATCEVLSAEGLAEDIFEALAALDGTIPGKSSKPDWYRRLERCATRGTAAGIGE